MPGSSIVWPCDAVHSAVQEQTDPVRTVRIMVKPSFAGLTLKAMAGRFFSVCMLVIGKQVQCHCSMHCMLQLPEQALAGQPTYGEEASYAWAGASELEGRTRTQVAHALQEQCAGGCNGKLAHCCPRQTC